MPSGFISILRVFFSLGANSVFGLDSAGVMVSWRGAARWMFSWRGSASATGFWLLYSVFVALVLSAAAGVM